MKTVLYALAWIAGVVIADVLFRPWHLDAASYFIGIGMAIFMPGRDRGEK